MQNNKSRNFIWKEKKPHDTSKHCIRTKSPVIKTSTFGTSRPSGGLMRKPNI